MYLIDTNVVSELYRGARGAPGVRAFVAGAAAAGDPMFLSAITVGELRRGVENLRHRGDRAQAQRVHAWFVDTLEDFQDRVLNIDAEIAQAWARLRVPRSENALDKLIAATALIYGLTVVTRNERHFAGTGVPVLNPFH